MPEQIKDIKVFSLLEVTTDIKKTITDRYKNSVWVKAEMNKLNYYPKSGHCYPELVEKRSGKIVVKINANLWKDDYLRINNKFIKVLNEPIKDNITILINVSITYDPLYGLNLKIKDIDPSYTLGELEREKLETIRRLKEEGIFENNKKLILPTLPKRMAIISVITSKGYADFFEVINSKKGIYEFHTQLFSSILQGDNAVPAIMFELNKIEKISSQFDMVAIVRGGGGDVGLSCYNNYSLAKRVALFPIPVLTGIGHSTNETVVEMVSNQNSITPTKLAEFVIEKYYNFSKCVLEFERKILDKSRSIVGEEKTKISNIVRLFNSVSRNHLLGDINDLKNISGLLQRTVKSEMAGSKTMLFEIEEFLKDDTTVIFQNIKGKLKEFAKIIKQQVNYTLIESKNQHKQILIKIKNSYKNNLNTSLSEISDLNVNLIKTVSNILENKTKEIAAIKKNVDLLNPINVLKRGYSITYLNGKAIKSHSELELNSEVNTVLFKGSFKSKTISIKDNSL